MKPIKIGRNTARTCFECSGSLKDKNVLIDVQRVGDGKRITYPALSVGDGKVCFAWDDELLQGKAGRYQGIIRGLGHDVCVSFDLIDDVSVGAASNIDFICGG